MTWEEILTFLTPIENPLPASHCIHLCLEVPERNSTEYSRALWGSRLSFQRTTIYSPQRFIVGSRDTYSTQLKLLTSPYMKITSPNVLDLLTIITLETKAHISHPKCQELMLPLRLVYMFSEPGKDA